MTKKKSSQRTTTRLRDTRRAKLKLARALRRRECVRVERRGADRATIYGFPLAVGADLVLFRVMQDFEIDGMAVVRLGDIVEVRSSAMERFTERILRDRGQLAAARPGRSRLRIGAWRDVFEALAATGDIVAIDCAPPELDRLVVGKVVGLTTDSVGVHYFNATAEWDSDPFTIPFDAVERVAFGDRYTRAFAPYVGDPPSG